MTVPGRKLDVELVEAGDDALGDGELLADASAPDEARSQRRTWTWRRVVRAWPLAVVALLVAGGYIVQDAREQSAFAAKQDALRGQDAFVERLDPDARLVPVAGLGGSFVVPVVTSGVLLLYSPGAGRVVTVALDIETDAELWRVEHDESDGGTVCGQPFAVGAANDGQVACVYQRGSVIDDEWVVAELELQLRDVRTGEVLRTRDMRGTPSAALWGEAILRFAPSDGGGTSLRLETFDGVELWAIPLFDDALAENDYGQIFVWQDRGIVAVRDLAIVVSVDGDLLVEERAERFESDETLDWFDGSGFPQLSVQPVDGGGFALSLSASSSSRALVLDADGGFAYEIEGRPVTAGLDDGSAGALAAWERGAELVVVDHATGEPRLRTDTGSRGVHFILDGALIADAGGRVRAIDIETQEERWSVIGPSSLVASDGAVVIAQEDGAAGSVLLALDLDSGEELWRIPLRGSESLVVPGGGSLFVLEDEKLYRLES